MQRIVGLEKGLFRNVAKKKIIIIRAGDRRENEVQLRGKPEKQAMKCSEMCEETPEDC